MVMLLTDEQIMLRDAARGFLQACAPIDQLRRLRDGASSDGYDRDTWKSMTELGWAGVLDSGRSRRRGYGICCRWRDC